MSVVDVSFGIAAQRSEFSHEYYILYTCNYRPEVQSCTGPWNSIIPWDGDFSCLFTGPEQSGFSIVLTCEPVVMLSEFSGVYVCTDGLLDVKHNHSHKTPK